MHQTGNKEITKNSIMLFLRMLITMWLNLYVTRIVLQNLGISDYGVYGAVGSVVSIFTIVNSGIINANQRFITYELGKKDGRPNIVFNTVLNIILLFSFFLLIIIEIAGLWFLQYKMNIPDDRKIDAIWAFQFSVITMLTALISAPYNALVIAHEKMNVFAYVSILQTVLTLIAGLSLKLFKNDRLFCYCLFLMLINILIRIIYQIYCRRKFEESKYKLNIDRKLIKEIGKFTGWSMLDGGLNTITWQGIIILFNISFGVTINAVYNIANQLKTCTLGFAQNVQKAISPQITKTYAAKDYERHCLLVYNGSKAQIYLIYLIIIPFIIKTGYILNLWLGHVPEYSVIFCQLAVLMPLLNAGFEPVRNSAYATGRIKTLSVIPNLCHMLLLPICYITNRIYNNPIIMMILVVIIDYIIYAIKYYLAAKVSVLNLFVFIKKVILPSVIIFFSSLILCFYINKSLSDNLSGMFFILIINIFIVTILFYTIGINNQERTYINSHLRTIAIKIFRKE